ncbi:MAG: acetoacetate--CoA ligase [Anaerolineae bacterium]|nr:acetoacetate--CoA ligase [Anaerolineae bacterium]
MQQIQEGTLLWTPSAEVLKNANLTQYRRWLAETRDLHFADYDALWQWSVTELEAFWQSIVEFCDVQFAKAATAILPDRTMPAPKWFAGAEINYAQNIFHHMTDSQPMMVFKAEDQALRDYSWQEIYQQTAKVAAALKALGVQKGDRVVNFMPNRPETAIAFLATASIGAIWSSCSPDFGAKSVLDRFTQIEPKVLFAVDGYHYGGKPFNRRAVVAELQQNLPTLEKTILLPLIAENTDNLSDTLLWNDVLSNAPDDSLHFEPVAFDHPLWVLYSSGTTGLPKPIVHGHGGIVLEHSKAVTLHLDLRLQDRFFWYTNTGWMMWNYLMGALFSGCTILLYDGNPAYPDMTTLFDFAEKTGMTYFGTSAAFVNACMKAEIHPNENYNLSKIRAVGSTGSPLTVNGFQWIYDNINTQLALESVSGGTDICGVLVGGARTKPIYAGEIQGAALGVKVEAFNEDGESVIDEVGELVITEPMPSMPIYFWNDPDKQRYTDAYFEMFPTIWRHGDWIKFTQRGTCIIYGRSDATINRQGIRMGTSEIYMAVESFEAIMDSLIIDLELLGRESYMPLFVVLREGHDLTDDLKAAIKQKLRQEISPRHVPNDIIAIEEVPYTLSGKKMEVPIRKILLGRDVTKAANRGAMRNPTSIDFFIDFAKTLPQ